MLFILEEVPPDLHKGMSLRDLGPATVRTTSLAGALASVWAE